MTEGELQDSAEKPVIYYWDERDGAAAQGWWIGIGVGGQQVWAHNTGSDMTPPLSGWKVPSAATAPAPVMSQDPGQGVRGGALSASRAEAASNVGPPRLAQTVHKASGAERLVEKDF